MIPSSRGPGPARQALPFAFALILLVAGCGGGGAEPVASCVTDPECGSGAYCLQGSCRASAAPVADFTGPAAPSSNRKLTFQAAVTDTDPADGVERHDWTVTRAIGACDAESTPTTGGTLELIFWCAGTYDVTLVATDLHGVPSAPVTRRLEVAQSSDLPTVVASSSTSGVTHHCTGQPLSCALGFPLELRATGAAPGGGTLEYEWRARPQNPLVTEAAVSYSPSALQASATVRIVTPGTAISGTWVFEVRVTAGSGLMARSSVDFTVHNRPPAFSSALMTLDHAYRGGVYEATGALTVQASDPDGDPVEVTAAYEEPGASGCTAAFEPATLALSLSCTQAAGLIGSVDREATVTAVDVNGEASQLAVPIQVLNRPPVIRLASSPAATEVALDHGNGFCLDGPSSCFRVDGVQPFAGEDPDGDPVSPAVLTALVDASAAHSSGETNPGSPASFHFSTPHAYPDEFRAADGASPFRLRGVVTDPFGATATGEAPVRVGNRPPAVAAPAPFVAVDHHYVPAPGEYVAVADLSTFEDPDGDPLAATGDGPAGCAEFGAGTTPGSVAVTCRLPYRPGAGDLPPLAQFLGIRDVLARASDPWSSASAGSSVHVRNRPPSLASSSGPLMGTCECVCPDGAALLATRPAALLAAILGPRPPGPTAGPCTECVPAPVSMRVDPQAADPDGDPLLLSYAGSITTTVRTAIPSQAAFPTPDAFPATWSVSAQDGGGGQPATAVVEITQVWCP